MKIRVLPAPYAVLPIAVAAAFAATSTFAQPSAAPQLKETVVTATRSAARADDLVGDVTVISRSEIEKSAGRTLPELLARVPGLQFSANGGLGKISGVNIRGAENRHTLLLIDGVPYGSATAGGPSWDNLPIELIDRIEIVKGPASALYGSQGVGGVIQIFTRQGSGGFKPYAAATGGAESFKQISGGFTGSSGATRYALSVAKTLETGFSATNPKALFGNYNDDRDGFNQTAASLSLAHNINADWKLDAGLVYADSVSRFDDGPNRDTRSAGRTNTLRAGVQGHLSAAWTSQFRVAQSVDESRGIVGGFLPSVFQTTQNQVSWQNDVTTPLGVVVAGVESLRQKIDSSTLYTVNQRSVVSYFAGLNGSSGAHSWQTNVRQDNNSQFGNPSTAFAGYGFRLTPAWRLNTSYGTSFVAPSFNQLYFPGFGNAALLPERGRNLDVGASWSDAGHTVKVVYFDNKIRGFITSTAVAANVPRARIDGTTLSYDGAYKVFSGALAVNASVDVLNPVNELTGKRLPRRSANQWRLGADYTTGLWELGGSLLRVGSSFDDTNNLRALGGYTTVDVYAAYQVGKDWKVQAKLNNLTDSVYETTYGYNQPRRGLFVTLKWQPK